MTGLGKQETGRKISMLRCGEMLAQIAGGFKPPIGTIRISRRQGRQRGVGIGALAQDAPILAGIFHQHHLASPRAVEVLEARQPETSPRRAAWRQAARRRQ